ncbi:MAG: class I SAM-dependent methyltransferase [Anaerolineae bacterium]|nr:class I SAM-dependent methyltransferase [Anaerolineae bacterium]
MPGDYEVLATIHTTLNMGAYARTITPHLIDTLQRNHWMGRQIIDIGCGAGESLTWLAQHGYVVTGVDRAPVMLAAARRTLKAANVDARLVEGDIRTIRNLSDFDLAIALDVMNEYNSLRELEETFRSIHNLLKPEKLFAFDFRTIEGLVQLSLLSDGDALVHDDDNLTIFTQDEFDYERQVQKRTYHIFSRVDELWKRTIGTRTQRAYPIQAITTLLQRTGFDVEHVLNENLQPHTFGDSTARVIIVGRKR